MIGLVQALQRDSAQQRGSTDGIEASPTSESESEAEVADALGYAAMLRQLSAFAPPAPSEETEPLFAEDGDADADTAAFEDDTVDEELEDALEQQLEVAQRSLRELERLFSSAAAPAPSPSTSVVATARWTG